MEIIHNDISGSLSHPIFGDKSFIIFTDDFSQFCYLYLINEKSEELEKFKFFKTEVEKQLGMVIKVVRSDSAGEYYGRYDSTGQHMRPFAKYL